MYVEKSIVRRESWILNIRDSTTTNLRFVVLLFLVEPAALEIGENSCPFYYLSPNSPILPSHDCYYPSESISNCASPLEVFFEKKTCDED